MLSLLVLDLSMCAMVDHCVKKSRDSIQAKFAAIQSIHTHTTWVSSFRNWEACTIDDHPATTTTKQPKHQNKKTQELLPPPVLPPLVLTTKAKAPEEQGDPHCPLKKK